MRRSDRDFSRDAGRRGRVGLGGRAVGADRSSPILLCHAVAAWQADFGGGTTRHHTAPYRPNAACCQMQKHRGNSRCPSSARPIAAHPKKHALASSRGVADCRQTSSTVFDLPCAAAEGQFDVPGSGSKCVLPDAVHIWQNALTGSSRNHPLLRLSPATISHLSNPENHFRHQVLPRVPGPCCRQSTPAIATPELDAKQTPRRRASSQGSATSLGDPTTSAPGMVYCSESLGDQASG